MSCQVHELLFVKISWAIFKHKNAQAFVPSSRKHHSVEYISKGEELGLSSINCCSAATCLSRLSMKDVWHTLRWISFDSHTATSSSDAASASHCVVELRTSLRMLRCC